MFWVFTVRGRNLAGESSMTQAVMKDPFQGPEERPGSAWGPLLWGSSSPLLILLWAPCTSPSHPSLHWRLFPSSIHLTSVCFCLVAKSCLTLGDPMDCSPPDSSVLGILQTRILQWGSHSLLQGIFSTQGLNPVSRIAVYRLGYQGSPYLCSKHCWKFLSLVPSFTSFPPLKCPIYSTSSLSRPFVSTQLQCILLLFLLKISFLPKAMPVARDISMNSAIKVVIIIELTLARGQDSLLQDIPHWHIILHWSHSWCGATCVFNKTAAATTILQPSSFPWKQEINRPCWRYPPYTNILITRDREFKAKKPV